MDEISYLSYFGLKEEPFSTVPNPRFLFLSAIHSIALSKTELVVSARKGLSVVFGDAGTGKSSLSRLLHQKFLDKNFTSVLLTNPNYPTPNSLLRTIAQEFQLPKISKAYKDNLDLFKLYLYQEAVEKNRTVVLIIDEAQTLKLPLLELMRQLINFETNEMKLLQLVLFSQDEFRTKLAHPQARNFRSRIAMASTLEQMGIADLGQMVDFRWRVASGNQENPFLPEAIDALFYHSGGTPREAGIIADNALLLAFLNQQKQIDRGVIEAAAKDRVDNIGLLKPRKRGKPEKEEVADEQR